MELIQIVPSLPPHVDGIGDYALQLARRLREAHGVSTTFLVCDPAWKGSGVEGFSAVCVAERSANALVAALESCRSQASGVNVPVLVQFAPYGYELRGCPFWLVDGLEQWHSAHPWSLHIAFHELETSSNRPWSSSFWVPPLQRALLQRLARIGSFKYTNTELHRGRLEAWGAGRITLIQNFSTMGEPIENPPFSRRRRDLLVFGRAAHRRWTYERAGPALRSVCESLQAERIIDIGQPIPGDTVRDLGGVPIVRCGRLTVEEINDWMSTTVASFVYYPVPLLTKSSIHAVSCAHGAIPLVYDDQRHALSCPGLIEGEDFFPISLGQPLPLREPVDQLSSALHRNYQARSSRAAAGRLHGALFSGCFQRT